MALWLRAESRPEEGRTPLVPEHAARLVAAGVPVTVEAAPSRAFPDEAYRRAGCRVLPPGTAPTNPGALLVLGLKRPADPPATIVHDHAFFAHAFRGQPGGRDLLGRFVAGGGTLYDLEAMTDAGGRRIGAFGHWAGFVGASLALLDLAGALGPLAPVSADGLGRSVRRLARRLGGARALVVGGRGRGGRGAVAAVRLAGLVPTIWGRAETGALDRAALLDHDILVNAIGADRPIPPLLARDDLGRGRLRVVADVTCDLGTPFNALPVYDRLTGWDRPAVPIGGSPVRIIAIDNLPAVVPREASRDFSSALAPHLARPPHGVAFETARRAYLDAIGRLGLIHAAHGERLALRACAPDRQRPPAHTAEA